MMTQIQTLIARALSAERERRWTDSLDLCEKALAAAPENPDALNLQGRLARVAGDRARSIALQRFVLRIAPQHEHAHADLALALSDPRAPLEAEHALARAVALQPDLLCHYRPAIALTHFAVNDEAAWLVRDAVDFDPSLAPAHAVLGNILARRQRLGEAIAAYQVAAMLDWSFVAAHMALAGLLEAAHDEARAMRHLREALALKRSYPACACAAPGALRVLLLAAEGGTPANAPLGFAVDPAQIALGVYYVDASTTLRELPAYDVVMNAMDELEASASAIAACVRLAAGLGAELINDPQRLIGLRRSRIGETLADIPGVHAPRCQRLDRATLSAGVPAQVIPSDVEGPFLIRPIDTHRGDGLDRVASIAEVATYLARHDQQFFNVMPFVDYRSADGYYRKYRVILVEGKAYPYHLAISSHWMVHYVTSEMSQHDWMRAEEARFLDDPDSVFPQWDTVFGDIASAIGLDYFGIDCARCDDGSVLVFEAGPSMVVHARDPLVPFAYKRKHIEQIFRAIQRMFERRAPSRI